MNCGDYYIGIGEKKMARPIEYTREELIEILQGVGVDRLSKRYFDSCKNLPGSATIIRKFGGWNKALEEAGIMQGIRTGRKPNSKRFCSEQQYLDDFVFFSKEYMYDYHKNHSDEQCIKELIIPFIKFLYEYVARYGWIYPVKTKINEWCDLIRKLKKMDGNLSSGTWSGNSEIKRYFSSFWDAKLNCFGESPIKLFYDEKLLIRFLKYRFGISNGKKYNYVFGGNKVETNELFDISFKQVRRAFEVNHYTVSVFKPLLAKWVYTKYGFDGMTTWDPCAGFAGRLLGFIASFDNGKYIGTDPNTKLCSELSCLVGDLNLGERVEIINSMMENFNISDVDLVFTCPPYFNTEIYCDEETQSSVKYSDKDAWDNGFLKTLLIKSYDSLKVGGKCIIMFDGKNSSLCQCMAAEVGFKFVEVVTVKNRKTHFTKKTNYEFILVFER